MSMYDSAEQFARQNICYYIDVLRTTSYSAPTNVVTAHVNKTIGCLETVKDAFDREDIELFQKCKKEIDSCIADIFRLRINGIGMYELTKHLMRIKTGDFVGLLIWAKTRGGADSI